MLTSLFTKAIKRVDPKQVQISSMPYYKQIFSSSFLHNSRKSLTHLQKQYFMNEIEINEEFTEQEMQIQNQYKDGEEELHFLHKEFNEKYLCQSDFIPRSQTEQQGDRIVRSKPFPPNYNRKNKDLQMKDNNYTEYQLSDLNNMTEGYENNTLGKYQVSYKIYYSLMKRIEEAPSIKEKLEVAQNFFFQAKSQEKRFNFRQYEGVLLVLEPLIKNFSQETYIYTTEELFILLNVCREDFLNYQLDQNVLQNIKNAISSSYKHFELEDIRRVMYSACLRHKDSLNQSILETEVVQSWISKIYDSLCANMCTEKELILFLTYLSKDEDLFKKSSSFITQLFLQDEGKLLYNTKDAEILKVLVTLFGKQHSSSTSQDKNSQSLFKIFICSFWRNIENKKLSPYQFQIILRNLLRSPMFIPSFFSSQSTSKWINIPSEEMKNASISNVSSYYLKIFDKMINEEMEYLTCNQVLNILNFYQITNAQQQKPTVLKLLQRLIDRFQLQCDNFFSFNITLRTLCIFEVKDPSNYLQLYKTPFKIPHLSSQQLQVVKSQVLLEQLLPKCKSLIRFPFIKQVPSHFVQNSYFQLDYINNEKKQNSQMVSQIFNRMGARYSLNTILLNSFGVDILIKFSPQNDKNVKNNQAIKQFPRATLAIEILNESDVSQKNQLVGHLVIKQKIIQSLKIKWINIYPYMITALLQQQNNPHQQEELLLQYILEQSAQ